MRRRGLCLRATRAGARKRGPVPLPPELPVLDAAARIDAMALPPDRDDAAPPGKRARHAPSRGPDRRPANPGRSRWAALPDRLTGFRLAIVPLLWVLAVLRESTWLGIGLIVAALTDVLDGPIARHYRRTTAAGSRRDSIADHALTASTAAWLVWLRPDFVREQLPLLAVWTAIGVAALLVGWARFRKIGDLHLYTAKVAGTLGYLFAIWLLLFGTYSVAVFHLVIGSCILASTESLLVVSTRSAVDERIGSILRAPRGGSRTK